MEADGSTQGEVTDAEEDVLLPVIRNFARTERHSLPKHDRLYRAFVDAIDAGDIRSHAQVPAELKVASRMGVSLGTVQRVLRRLAESGLVSRRHGHGTFVSERQIPEEELWQFRFVGDTSSRHYLPIYAKLRKVRMVAGKGRWSEALGSEPDGFVYIERLIRTDSAKLCLSRMYLPGSRFGEVMNGRLIELNPINIKLLLRREFGAHTAMARQVIRFVRMSAAEAGLLDTEPGITTIQLEATGYDQDGSPFTYHQVLIPPSERVLDISFSGVPIRAFPENSGDGALRK